MSRLRVGVSVFATSGANLWANGVNQNLAFLVMLLKACPNVGQLWLLNGGDATELSAHSGLADMGVQLVHPHEVTHELDCVIEMGAQLPLPWLHHVRALGVKIVTFFVGNTYADLCEAPMFDLVPGHIFNGTPWHEVWTLPKDEHLGAPLLRTVTRVPVFTLPHIWSPVFLERHAANLAAEGLRFGFDPAARGGPEAGWRAGIFEPNISVVKSCFIPMLACEHAYRQDRRSLALMMVMNAFHMKEHLTFNRLASGLDITREHKASYEPRIMFAECMARHRLDVVVSHHWGNPQNYLYYDTLHGGYPLVHNSDLLRGAGVGFHYPGFEATAGGDELLRAWRQAPEFWGQYRRDARAFLAQLDPTRDDNVAAFAARLSRADGAAA